MRFFKSDKYTVQRTDEEESLGILFIIFIICLIDIWLMK